MATHQTTVIVTRELRIVASTDRNIDVQDGLIEGLLVLVLVA
jgi:hypothetical protein